MDSSQIAFAALGRCQTGGAADVEQLGSHSLTLELRQQIVEPHAVTADDDQIRDLKTATDQSPFDRLAGVDDFSMSTDRHAAIGPTDSSHGTLAFAQRERRPALAGFRHTDQQIFGAADF